MSRKTLLQTVRDGYTALKSDDRGQTLNDYAIGMGLFLMTVFFVFGQVPALMQPFTTAAGQGNTIQADRSASHLVEDVLSDNQYSDQPTTLDKSCTKAFFKGDDASDCEYDGSSLQATLGLRSHEHARVVVQNLGDGSIASLDGVRLVRGPSVPESSSSAMTSRIVSINGESYRLIVYIW